jgi:hypothetical protein
VAGGEVRGARRLERAPLHIGGCDNASAACDKSDAIERQYFRANVDPSARYVISPPGAIGGTRLHPAGSTFNHLWLAGDWTLNGLNAGCAEAATTSGILASRALAGEPRDATFTDYFGQAGQPPAEATQPA